MNVRPILVLSVVLGLAASGFSQATQPGLDPRVELRANQAFNRGEYATALPLLRKLAEQFKAEPSRLGSVQEKIRVCQKALDSAAKDPAAAAPRALAVGPGAVGPGAAAAPDVPMDPETRKKHPAPKKGEVQEMAIKELGNFDYDSEHGGNIPADVKRLSGSRIRLKGFMIPMDQAQNITQFALVPSLFACCYGQPPQIQHTVVVNCPRGKAVSYSPDEIIVEGELKVEEKKDDGYIVSIFEMTASSVKVAPPTQ